MRTNTFFRGSSDSESELDEPQLFQRNIPIRSTPLNTKRKIRSGDAKQKVVADLEVTQLPHKRPLPPAINSNLPDVVSGPSTGAVHLNYQQKIKLKEWVQEERSGRHKMKNGAIQRIIERIQNNFNLKLTYQQVENLVRRSKSVVKENTAVYFTEKEKRSYSV